MIELGGGGVGGYLLLSSTRKRGTFPVTYRGEGHRHRNMEKLFDLPSSGQCTLGEVIRTAFKSSINKPVSIRV